MEQAGDESDPDPDGVARTRDAEEAALEASLRSSRGKVADLRIIYGPEYTAPENLERLRAGGLSTKRSLALREFALGIESLERFVRKEPLRRVHDAVFVVLALEREPVDPRL